MCSIIPTKKGKLCVGGGGGRGEGSGGRRGVGEGSGEGGEEEQKVGMKNSGKKRSSP